MTKLVDLETGKGRKGKNFWDLLQIEQDPNNSPLIQKNAKKYRHIELNIHPCYLAYTNKEMN